MRVLLQRVARASVSIEGRVTGEIGRGLLLLLGVAPEDTLELAQRMAGKCVGLRIFEDDAGRMNLSVADVGGAVLCVSQFTLYGDTRRGKRPSFMGAAEPVAAETLYGRFCGDVAALGVRCERGVFGAHMMVDLVNDGPVTLMLDSVDFERPRRA